METFRIRGSSETGAMLVHVAVALLGLMAVSAFAVDFGVFWLSRRAAQNSADAAAMAGAIALAYDDADDFSSGTATPSPDI
jgi:Flp pilus assembly protein TadG